MRKAARFGVHWIFQKLAFSEFTRGPVEVHMRRPAKYVLMDLAAIDAMSSVRHIRSEKRK